MISVDLFREVFPDAFEGQKVRVQVFKVGEWQHPSYGPITVTREDIERMVSNFNATDRALVVDYDHGTDMGMTPEQSKAAGWIRELVVEDDGNTLWAVFDATEDGAEYVRKGEYRFFSPTFVPEFTNKETGEPQGFTLLRGALTNNPFIDGMHPAVPLSERAAERMQEQMAVDGGGGGERRLAERAEVGVVTSAGLRVERIPGGVRFSERKG